MYKTHTLDKKKRLQSKYPLNGLNKKIVIYGVYGI